VSKMYQSRLTQFSILEIAFLQFPDSNQIVKDLVAGRPGQPGKSRP